MGNKLEIDHYQIENNKEEKNQIAREVINSKSNKEHFSGCCDDYSSSNCFKSTKNCYNNCFNKTKTLLVNIEENLNKDELIKTENNENNNNNTNDNNSIFFNSSKENNNNSNNKQKESSNNRIYNFNTGNLNNSTNNYDNYIKNNNDNNKIKLSTSAHKRKNRSQAKTIPMILDEHDRLIQERITNNKKQLIRKINDSKATLNYDNTIKIADIKDIKVVNGNSKNNIDNKRNKSLSKFSSKTKVRASHNDIINNNNKISNHKTYSGNKYPPIKKISSINISLLRLQNQKFNKKKLKNNETNDLLNPTNSIITYSPNKANNIKNNNINNNNQIIRFNNNYSPYISKYSNKNKNNSNNNDDINLNKNESVDVLDNLDRNYNKVNKDIQEVEVVDFYDVFLEKFQNICEKINKKKISNHKLNNNNYNNTDGYFNLNNKRNKSSHRNDDCDKYNNNEEFSSQSPFVNLVSMSFTLLNKDISDVLNASHNNSKSNLFKLQRNYSTRKKSQDENNNSKNIILPHDVLDISNNSYTIISNKSTKSFNINNYSKLSNTLNNNNVNNKDTKEDLYNISPYEYNNAYSLKSLNNNSLNQISQLNNINLSSFRNNNINSNKRLSNLLKPPSKRQSKTNNNDPNANTNNSTNNYLTSIKKRTSSNIFLIDKDTQDEAYNQLKRNFPYLNIDNIDHIFNITEIYLITKQKKLVLTNINFNFLLIVLSGEIVISTSLNNKNNDMIFSKKLVAGEVFGDIKAQTSHSYMFLECSTISDISKVAIIDSNTINLIISIQTANLKLIVNVFDKVPIIKMMSNDKKIELSEKAEVVFFNNEEIFCDYECCWVVVSGEIIRIEDESSLNLGVVISKYDEPCNKSGVSTISGYNNNAKYPQKISNSICSNANCINNNKTSNNKNDETYDIIVTQDGNSNNNKNINMNKNSDTNKEHNKYSNICNKCSFKLSSKEIKNININESDNINRDKLLYKEFSCINYYSLTKINRNNNQKLSNDKSKYRNTKNNFKYKVLSDKATLIKITKEALIKTFGIDYKYSVFMDIFLNVVDKTKAENTFFELLMKKYSIKLEPEDEVFSNAVISTSNRKINNNNVKNTNTNVKSIKNNFKENVLMNSGVNRRRKSVAGIPLQNKIISKNLDFNSNYNNSNNKELKLNLNFNNYAIFNSNKAIGNNNNTNSKNMNLNTNSKSSNNNSIASSKQNNNSTMQNLNIKNINNKITNSNSPNKEYILNKINSINLAALDKLSTNKNNILINKDNSPNQDNFINTNTNNTNNNDVLIRKNSFINEILDNSKLEFFDKNSILLNFNDKSGCLYDDFKSDLLIWYVVIEGSIGLMDSDVIVLNELDFFTSDGKYISNKKNTNKGFNAMSDLILLKINTTNITEINNTFTSIPIIKEDDLHMKKYISILKKAVKGFNALSVTTMNLLKTKIELFNLKNKSTVIDYDEQCTSLVILLEGKLLKYNNLNQVVKIYKSGDLVLFREMFSKKNSNALDIKIICEISGKKESSNFYNNNSNNNTNNNVNNNSSDNTNIVNSLNSNNNGQTKILTLAFNDIKSTLSEKMINYLYRYYKNTSFITNLNNTKYNNNNYFDTTKFNLLNVNSKSNSLITISNLKIISLLGEGAFAKVFLITINNTYFALKVFSHEKLINKDVSKYYFTEEIINSSSVISPFITRTTGLFYDRSNCYVLMEFDSSVNLRQVLNDYESTETISYRKIKQIFMNILLAVKAIHSQNIVHRDLKPENIIITNEGLLKVIDFGVSKRIKNYTSTIVGTSYYMSPDILGGKSYGKNVDYWAVGIILYEIIYGCSPYNIVNKEDYLVEELIGEDLYINLKNKYNKYDNIMDLYRRIYSNKGIVFPATTRTEYYNINTKSKLIKSSKNIRDDNNSNNKNKIREHHINLNINSSNNNNKNLNNINDSSSTSSNKPINNIEESKRNYEDFKNIIKIVKLLLKKNINNRIKHFDDIKEALGNASSNNSFKWESFVDLNTDLERFQECDFSLDNFVNLNDEVLYQSEVKKKNLNVNEDNINILGRYFNGCKLKELFDNENSSSYNDNSYSINSNYISNVRNNNNNSSSNYLSSVGNSNKNILNNNINYDKDNNYMDSNFYDSNNRKLSSSNNYDNIENKNDRIKNKSHLELSKDSKAVNINGKYNNKISNNNNHKENNYVVLNSSERDYFNWIEKIQQQANK